MTTIISRNTIETKKIGRDLAAKFSGGEVVCLYGELGAGKTVFVQGMVEYFLPGKRVLSPTFIIVRQYTVNHKSIKKFLHTDLYRLADLNEIKELEFFESANISDTVVAIEWAEKLQKLLPQKRIDIHINNLDGYRREIKIEVLHP